MGLLRETLTTILPARKSAFGATVPVFQVGRAQFPNFQYETLVKEGYSKNEIVHACIEEWATDIAEPDVVAVRGGEVLAVHPAVDLLTHPNPWLSGSDFMSGIEMYLRLAGNAYIEKVRSRAGRPVELWLLRPDRVKVIPDAQRYIAGYEYRLGAETFTIPADDMVHFKIRHPLDDYYGMPPLMAAGARVDIDNFLRDVVKAFLMNTGIPSGILTLTQKMEDQEKELLRSRFTETYGGRNAGRIIVADDGAEASFTPMSMPLGARGLVVPELDEIDESRIAMVFRVPQSLVGTRLGMASSSYANRRTDREFFTEQQLVPEWVRLADSLSRALVPEFEGERPRLYRGTCLKFDLTTVRSLSAHQDALYKRTAQAVQAGLISLEEGRDALGYRHQIDPADTFLIPANIVPMSGRQVLMETQPQAPAGPSRNGNGTGSEADVEEAVPA